MHYFLSAILLAVTFLSPVSATVDVHSLKSTIKKASKTAPGVYVVELDQPLDRLGRRSEENPHNALYTSLHKRGAKWSIRREYNTPGIFVGVAIDVESERDLAALADVAEVVSISPVYIRPHPKLVGSRRLKTKNSYALDSFAPHTMTGVDKLHAEGILGQGIRVALIDSGVDYLHPALGGGFGPGFKVSHGMDLVGDDYTGMNDPVPDDDPMDCTGHGTHVAGILGADSNPYNFTGVAPQADIGMYKVFGCTGFVLDDVVIDAMLRAYHDRHDIISLSLGSEAGWSEGATGVVASRIAATGVVVTVAAGNSGQYGAFEVSSPSTGKNVISVASVENAHLVVQEIQLNNGHSPIPYYSIGALNVHGSRRIYSTSQDPEVEADACSPLPESTPDLRKYIVLIRNGGCSVDDKAANVKARGAKYVLFYDDNDEPRYIWASNIVSAMISKADGEYLVDQFVKRRNVLLTFPQNQAPSTFPSAIGGLVSSFSSYGPTWDMEFKPSVAAPGGNILSTVPRSQGSYAINSGTSMATPFTAGVAALILQQRGTSKADAIGVRGLLESTGKAIRVSKNRKEPLQTLAQAGSGLLNAYKAVHSKIIVTPTQLRLNDTAHIKKSHTITVKNTSNKAQKFKITHLPAGTMNPFDSEQKAYHYPVPIDTHYARVTFKPSTLVVQPGKSAQFVATIHPPRVRGADRKHFPIYSGYLKIRSATSSVHVAYMGIVGKMKDMKILDRTPDYFGTSGPFLANDDGDVQTGPETYRWEDDLDYPWVVYRKLAGSPLIRIDLVSAHAKLDARGMNLEEAPEHFERSTPDGTLDRKLYSPGSNRVPEFDARSPKQKHTFPILGNLMKDDYTGRNTDGSYENDGSEWFPLRSPTFSNGTFIPNGRYKILLRALKITGDEKKHSDYESWLSPKIIIDY
ncbi:hypothetical protein FRC01_003515 [Tulasnella sp. 417]|nr:hypothetical protein FRC01_003515 [Tulasnella sp. 417]